LGFCEGFEQAREASVPMCQFEFAEQPRHAFVKHGDAVPTGGLREGTGQPGFSYTAWARDHQVAFVFDPAPGQHLLEQGFVEAAPGFVIHVFRRCTYMAQLCRAHAALETLGLTTGGLAISE